ncbi:MAG: hypothetical protein EOO40_12405 [Deltaproteobacteria bacterium]|nr:MAG: hypothetical protein EOO40_12405 [Deltaproteobacteria bacterium]
MTDASRFATHITRQQLCARGWTSGLIRRFLGAPDQTQPNPRYRSQAPMQLYAMARVTNIEATAIWLVAQAAAHTRRGALQAAADRRRIALEAEAKAMPIAVRRVAQETLLVLAIADYNMYQRNIADHYGIAQCRTAHRSCPLKFLQRIQVDYARHVLTTYDDGAAARSGLLGVRHAAHICRERTLAKIAEAFPWLKQECDRQCGAKPRKTSQASALRSSHTRPQ